MGTMTCTKDGVEATEVVLERYEYEEGIPLHNVPAYECPACGEFIFTEAQVDEMATCRQKVRIMPAGKRKFVVEAPDS